MRALPIKPGMKFGLLTVIEIVPGKGQSKRRMAKCLCDCGKEFVTHGFSLNNGDSVSCGCKRKGLAKSHGKSRTRTYRIWADMLTRCTNPNFKHYHRYGGRGISVCERWSESFAAFLEDMGECPAGLTIERMNNDGNYEPGNCRWATRLEQAHNRSRPNAEAF